MSMLLSLSRRLSAVAAAGLVMAVAAPAQAGVIASFDPAFGPSIPNLGFRGTINLDVTPGCYTLGSGFQFTGGTCQITATAAQINYYNSNPLASGATITTVNLLGSFFDPNYVFGAYFDPVTGQLAGLDTNDSAEFFVSVNDVGAGPSVSYSGNMLLYFSSGTEPVGRISAAAVSLPPPVPPSSSVPGVGGAFLVDCRASDSQESFCSSGDPSTTSNPGRLVFTTVPEPDSITLALLGFGSLVLARRRRARIAR